MKLPKSEPMDYSTPRPRGRLPGWAEGVILAIASLAVAAIVLLWISVAMMQLKSARESSSRINNATPTKREMNNVRTALETFETNSGRYPTSSEGLKALVERPAGLAQWNQLFERVPFDEWGHSFQYRSHDDSYDLISAGPDGVFGTDDDIDH